MRILLVEDEESLRVTLAANLELEGYEVVEADDGRHAIEILAREKVDFVLSDIRMPRLGGVELLQAVKQAYPDLPVVLMTAQALEEQIDTAIAAGAFTVLKKPFDVAGAIASLLSAARRPIVLIVDDDRANAETLAAAFSVVGVASKAVFGGEEALSALEDQPVDVCVTDLVMPGLDGLVLAHRVRAAHPDISIIVVSGHDTSRLLQGASGAGIFACLRKPVTVRELLGVVAKARGGAWAL